jgi:hypothetical protein
MAQNTERWPIGNLMIRYSPEYPIDAGHASKLDRSLSLATRAVRRAIEMLDEVSSATEVMARPGSSDRPMIGRQRFGAGQAFVPEVPYLALRYHFRLPGLSPGDGDAGDNRLTQRAWSYYAVKIANELRMIELGLRAPIVISDSSASIIGREMMSQREAAEETIRKDKGMTPLEKDYARKFATLTGFKAGVVKAQEARGFVRPKKRVVRGLTDSQCDAVMRGAHLDLTAEQKGSIHLNFDLLRDPTYSTVCIARTLVHEAGHKFCDLDDVAYADDPRYRQMDVTKALKNADSYAYAVMSLYKGHVFLKHDNMRQAPASIDMNS